MTNHIPLDQSSNWNIIESGFDPTRNQLYETLFALGNGHLGMRGNFTEGLPAHSVEGTYINGFYDSEKIDYGEKLHGFPEYGQTMLNVGNAKVVEILIEEESFNMLAGKVLRSDREFDMRAGILRRSVTWRSPAGRDIQLDTQRLILHRHRHLAVQTVTLTPLNFSGTISFNSYIDTQVGVQSTADSGETHDPRLGTGFSGRALTTTDLATHGNRAYARQQTQRSGLQLQIATETTVSGAASITTQPLISAITAGHRFTCDAEAGKAVELVKCMAFVSSIHHPKDQLKAVADAELDQAQAAGIKTLIAEQRSYLNDFWNQADIQIEFAAGQSADLQRGLRFNMIHLLQSVGKDGRTNIAAKGLTGEGYEGHYFWDTEIYIFPFFLYNAPQISRKLLEFRHSILDSSRHHARLMGHKTGALYPWRTIAGGECSAYFPAGSAQYHLNADIALAVQRYYNATDDAEFMVKFGAEMLIETARLWIDVGFYNRAKGGRFCINNVTGPDEYTAIVNNNVYTNLMAAENLRFAAEICSWLAEHAPRPYARLAAQLQLEPNEIAAWKKAADLIYLPNDDDSGVIPQDDSFFDKAIWDFDNTPAEHYPLLLHYHPLALYRHQVCKQADLLLAHLLLPDSYDTAQKRRDFDYYEPITTHDSSLSACIFGIIAAEVGYADKAYAYFADTATTDLDNKKGNTKDGVHAANMAGAWQSIIYGFGGMRIRDRRLTFAPTIPAVWQSYTFNIAYRGRKIQLHVTAEESSAKLVSGSPISIWVNGQERPLS